jgi:hypothetical protein
MVRWLTGTNLQIWSLVTASRRLFRLDGSLDLSKQQPDLPAWEVPKHNLP